MEYTARMNEHALVSRAAAAGSCVLLKNIENTLPFAGSKDEPTRVAIFGIGQIFTPTGLTGMEPWRKIGILDGLTAEPPSSRTRFWRTNTARGRSSIRKEARCRSEVSAWRSSPP